MNTQYRYSFLLHVLCLLFSNLLHLASPSIHKSHQIHTNTKDLNDGIQPIGCFHARKLKIVVTVDDVYFPLFMNWIANYYPICNDISDLYMVCLNTDAENLLTKHGLTCAAVYKSGDATNFMLERTKLIGRLLSNGYDVLQSDVDAIWVKSPAGVIQQYLDTSDIVGSRDKGALCMGFAYTKCSKYTVSLWKEIAHMVKKAKIGSKKTHDQKQVNELMSAGGRPYNSTTLFATNYVETSSFVFQQHKFYVTLLSYESVVRFCEDYNSHNVPTKTSSNASTAATGNAHISSTSTNAASNASASGPYVVHCHTTIKHGEHYHEAKMRNHQELANATGLWLLKSNWESIRYSRTKHRDWSDYLAEITETTTTTRERQ